jgi:hypothetical protein
MKWYHLWPILIGPAAVVVIAVMAKQRGGMGTYDDWHIDADIETLAPWLVLAAAAVYWIRAIATRNPLYVILTVFTGVLLLRELHWNPAIKDAAPPLLVICLVWPLIWCDLVKRPLADRKHTVWLIAALATYAFSQMIERRVFKFLPDEGEIHSKYEEAVELAGHVAILVAAAIGSWLHYGPGGKITSIREAFWPSPSGRFFSWVLRRKPTPPADDGAGC